MIFRGMAYAIPISILIWALLAWGACQASGATSVQAISDATALELTRILGVEVEPRAVLVTNEMENPSAAGEFWAREPYRYRLRPWVAVAARGGWLYDHFDYRQRQRMLGMEILVHELLHRADTQPCWGLWPGGINVEEGIVDALTIDLVPTLVWRVHRKRVSVSPTYPEYARAIWAASRFATGSSGWRTPAARHWRRALWRADCEGRRAMLTYANERRAA